MIRRGSKLTGRGRSRTGSETAQADMVGRSQVYMETAQQTQAGGLDGQLTGGYGNTAKIIWKEGFRYKCDSRSYTGQLPT